MDSRDKEKILQADGYTQVVRLPLFDETYTYPTNKEAVQDE